MWTCPDQEKGGEKSLQSIYTFLLKMDIICQKIFWEYTAIIFAFVQIIQIFCYL